MPRRQVSYVVLDTDSSTALAIVNSQCLASPFLDRTSNNASKRFYRSVLVLYYTNFKGALHGEPVRDRAYGRCWAAMREAQREAMRPAPEFKV